MRRLVVGDSGLGVITGDEPGAKVDHAATFTRLANAAMVVEKIVSRALAPSSWSSSFSAYTLIFVVSCLYWLLTDTNFAEVISSPAASSLRISLRAESTSAATSSSTWVLTYS